MEWSEFLNILIKVVIIPLLGVLSTFLVNFIKAKSNEAIARTDSEVLARYIRMAQETVSACVVATNQTFVDTLKVHGMFDKEAQEEALRRTKEAVMNILSHDAIEYLTTAVGDLDVYLNSLIEAQVKVNKTVPNIDPSLIVQPEEGKQVYHGECEGTIIYEGDSEEEAAKVMNDSMWNYRKDEESEG